MANTGATYGITPAGPPTSTVISVAQSAARYTAALLNRVNLNLVGRAITFTLIPNSARGGTVAGTAASVATTAVHNTSPLWMPIFLETTLGKPAAWVAITLFGVPNAPSYVLVGTAIGTYMLFTSAANAINWAMTKSDKQVNAIMQQLADAINVAEKAVAQKEQELDIIQQGLGSYNEVLRDAHRKLSEYSKPNGGKYNIQNPDDLESARDQVSNMLKQTEDLHATLISQEKTAQAELEQANQGLANARQRQQDAEAAYTAQIERLRLGASSSTSSSSGPESAEPVATIEMDQVGLDDFVEIADEPTEQESSSSAAETAIKTSRVAAWYRWMTTKSPAQVETIMHKLNETATAAELKEAEKQAQFDGIVQEIQLNRELQRSLQTRVSEYSKVNGGIYQIEDTTAREAARERAAQTLLQTESRLSNLYTQRPKAEQELLQARSATAAAKLQVEQAEAKYAEQIAQLPRTETISAQSSLPQQPVRGADFIDLDPDPALQDFKNLENE